MNLTFNTYYQGANVAKAQDSGESAHAVSQEQIDALNEAYKDSKVDNGKGVEITLHFQSEMVELKDLYESPIIEEDPNDPFSAYKGDQWAVFSQSLYENGFFDDKTYEETEKIEAVLKKITDGIDGLRFNSYGIDLHSEHIKSSVFGDELTSLEANLELESSTAAMRYFADKLLEGETKEDFLKLTNTYHSRNADRLKGYVSMEEGFEKVRMLYKGTTDTLSESRHRNTLRGEDLEESRRALNTRNTLTRIKLRMTSYDDMNKGLAKYFKNLGKSTNSNQLVMKAIKEAVTAYYTKGEDNKDVEKALNDETQDTYENMESYWNDLIDLTDELI